MKAISVAFRIAPSVEWMTYEKKRRVVFVAPLS